MEFAGALRNAVQESGLTLERIRHRLAGRGLAVSVATLSYWQRGRSRPRSRPVVAALEEILALPPGTLTSLLDDAAPGTPRLWHDMAGYARLVGQFDRSGDHRLEWLSVHDVYALGPARRSAGLAVRTVLRAGAGGIDRVICVHDVGPGPGAELTRTRYSRPGRVRTEGRLLGFELVFDRVLAAGDCAVVEYELTPRGPLGAVDRYARPFARPARDYVAVVQFDAATLPARCYGFSAGTATAPRQRLGELWVGTSGSAHLAVPDVRGGIVGVEWEWD
ncbi:hypothetical protein [Actinomadura flavalba]|uniref:hypothetical protein n=1 Tax=Actinomadura flavalba TaxID=1120938 RepID=UPI00038011B3|nr:hypothetical protein [Actinomadura flavalba]